MIGGVMKKKHFLFLFIIIILLCGCEKQKNKETINVQPEATVVLPTLIPPTLTLSPTSTTAANSLVNQNGFNFISALISGRKDTVAEFISYPLDIDLRDGNIILSEPSEFMDEYDVIFNDEIISQFAESFKKGISYSGLTRTTISVVDGFVEFDLDGKVIAIYNRTAKTTLLIRTLTPTATQDPKSCYATAMTQYAINICAGQQFTSITNKLHSLILELNPHMKTSQYDLLLKAQESWEKATDDFCIWDSSYFDGGTAKGSINVGCLISEYRERINDLRIYLCNDEGYFEECAASLKFKER